MDRAMARVRAVGFEAYVTEGLGRIESRLPRYRQVAGGRDLGPGGTGWGEVMGLYVLGVESVLEVAEVLEAIAGVCATRLNGLGDEQERKAKGFIRGYLYNELPLSPESGEREAAAKLVAKVEELKANGGVVVELPTMVETRAASTANNRILEKNEPPVKVPKTATFSMDELVAVSKLVEEVDGTLKGKLEMLTETERLLWKIVVAYGGNIIRREILSETWTDSSVSLGLRAIWNVFKGDLVRFVGTDELPIVERKHQPQNILKLLTETGRSEWGLLTGRQIEIVEYLLAKDSKGHYHTLEEIMAEKHVGSDELTRLAAVIRKKYPVAKKD
jgi:hypothetical protein